MKVLIVHHRDHKNDFIESRFPDAHATVGHGGALQLYKNDSIFRPDEGFADGQWARFRYEGEVSVPVDDQDDVNPCLSVSPRRA